mmetsp:Transcript_23009/g.74991  ORF Transcript_23009/g.74991 Transcript_23009/m.74991 type:complete len:257 (+) Transcript_23009:567-1337(+)
MHPLEEHRVLKVSWGAFVLELGRHNAGPDAEPAPPPREAQRGRVPHHEHHVDPPVPRPLLQPLHPAPVRAPEQETALRKDAGVRQPRIVRRLCHDVRRRLGRETVLVVVRRPRAEVVRAAELLHEALDEGVGDRLRVGEQRHERVRAEVALERSEHNLAHRRRLVLLAPARLPFELLRGVPARSPASAAVHPVHLLALLLLVLRLLLHLGPLILAAAPSHVRLAKLAPLRLLLLLRGKVRNVEGGDVSRRRRGASV